MIKPEPARYRTTNWKSYNEALRRRESLLIWLDRDMEWLGPRAGRPGRPPVFSDAAIQFTRSPFRQHEALGLGAQLMSDGCMFKVMTAQK